MIFEVALVDGFYRVGFLHDGVLEDMLLPKYETKAQAMKVAFQMNQAFTIIPL